MGAAFFKDTSEGWRWFRIYVCISVVLLTKAFWDVKEDIVADIIVDEAGNFFLLTSFSTSSSLSMSSKTIRKLYWLMNIIGVKCVIFSAVFLIARKLETEYAKSEELLLNILLHSIVKRINRGEFPIADHVPDVTILFADLGEW